MHDGEQWQVFAQNGQAVTGRGAIDDGEVDSVEWCSLSKFKEMMKDPERHKFVDCGAPYFEALTTVIHRHIA